MSIWDELGLPPTRDAKAIRRAYAVRLKRLDPDADPAGFQRLRQAYEAALAEAALPVPATLPDGEPETELEIDEPEEHRPDADEDGRPMPPPPIIPRYVKLQPPPPTPREPRRRAPVAPIDAADALRTQAKPLIEKLEQAMADFDATRAVEVFDEAMAKGLLPLTLDPALVTRLSKLALYDQALPPETFCRLMRQFGWHAAGRNSRVEASLASAILARLEAEGWYSGLLDQAAGRGRQARVARMLLGRNSRYLYYLADAKLLKQQVAQYDRHKFWLSRRFDGKRMDSLRRNQAPKEDRMSRAGWWTMMALATLVTGLVRTCTDALPPMH